MEIIRIYYPLSYTHLIPKNWYTPEYTKYTFVNKFTFELFVHSYGYPKRVKRLFFPGIFDLTWLLDYQNRIKPTKLILSHPLDF